MNQTPARKIPYRPLIFVAFIATCFAIANLPVVSGQLTLEAVNAKVGWLSEMANSPYGPILYIAISIVVIMLQVPGLLTVAVAGLVYGFWEALIYSMIASTIGLSGSFLIARFLLRDYFLPKLEKSFLARFLPFLKSGGLGAMVVLRLLFSMAPPLNWLMGATSVRTRDYILGTFLGLIPIVTVVLLMVRKLRTIQSMNDLWQPEVLIIMGAIVALGVSVFLLRVRMMKKKQGASN
jgi:uncharacterized membrane protein YdjX (TVP38/TMEM64 family)